MDALNRVIDALRLKATKIHVLDIAPPWGIGLNAIQHCSFHIVHERECWLRMGEELLHLSEGDLIAINNQTSYALLPDPASEAIPLADYMKNEAMRQKATDADTRIRLICSTFEPKYEVNNTIFSLLPSLIHIKQSSSNAPKWLGVSVSFIKDELTQRKPGYETVIERMMDISFIMLLRFWINDHTIEDRGWLKALYHPQLGPLMVRMHTEPEKNWTVESLAEVVNMSRSNLAMQFSQLVGESPMKYLTRWRMQMAVILLMETPNASLEIIAGKVGYRSVFAFSRAFKRHTGLSPQQYRNQ